MGMSFDGEPSRTPQLEPPQKDWSQDAISKRLDTYVGLDDFTAETSNKFNYRGFCKKCGWQSYQMLKEQAIALVREHAQRHLVGN